VTLVVDSSAVMALLLDEQNAAAIEFALAESHPVVMSAATLVELTVVAEARLGPQGALAVDRIIRYADIEVVPFTGDAASEAIDGWRRFGKGRHQAALNLGDCYTYGLARSRDAAVLCVGNDFAQTDIELLPL
jgi:ribonuclease VapC